MKTTAVSVSRLPMTSGFGYARVRDFVTLMKPRVMLLTVFTAVVGLLIAPGAIDPQRGILSIVAIAAGAGAAAVLNMWYDADIGRRDGSHGPAPDPQRSGISRRGIGAWPDARLWARWWRSRPLPTSSGGRARLCDLLSTSSSTRCG